MPSEEQLFTGEEKLVATESDQFAHNADYAHRDHSSDVDILTPRRMLPMQLSKRISNPTTSRSRKVLFCPSLTKLGVQFQTNEEPPQRVIEVLIDTFLQRFAGSAYFFLEPVSFRQSALLPFPPGRSSRPSASLLNAVYLWGSYLSSDAGHYTEDDFLALVLHNSVHDLLAIDAEGISIQLIQTEVLLSFWYLNSGQPLQGRRHCSVALSLAWSSGFQIHSVYQKSVADHPPTEISKALGSILLLDKYWVIASDIPSNFLFNPAPCVMDSLPDGPHRPILKAAILLERSIQLTINVAGIRCESPAQFLLQTVYIDFHNPSEFSMMDFRVEALRKSLSSLVKASATSSDLLLTNCMVNTAVIRLHSPRVSSCEESTRRCIMAADQMASDIILANVSDWGWAEPISGPVISTACRFYITNMPVSLDRSSNMKRLVSVMESLAARSPIIHQCYAEMQELYISMSD